MGADYTSLISSSFGGIIGLSTGSFYALGPGGIPVEPLADIIPSVTPFRVAVSMIDREQHTQSYRVTMNSLQDFSETTGNVHKELARLTITGVFSSAPAMSLSGLPPLPSFGFRLDLLQIANLERMASLRRPIMVVTPRVSLASAFITSIQRPWVPKQGPNTPVVVSLVEARIASPFSVDVLPDTDLLDIGNVESVGGGEISTKPIGSVNANPPAVDQGAPTIGSAGDLLPI